MSPIPRTSPAKAFQVISEMVAIQPCESKVHVAFSVGGEKTGGVAFEGVYFSSHSWTCFPSADSGFKRVCSYIFILYPAVALFNI